MTDTTSQIAMRPPRIEEGYARPTVPERERFFGTARSMAAPALESARANLEASRGGVGPYFANMPMAALNLADAAVRGGVGAFADLVPGLSPAAERDLAREVLGMGEAAAGSVARVPDALDEGLGGLSEVARRMFQEGPVPERLMAGIDPEEFLRAMRGRRDAAELQRRREDMIAGGVPEAEVDRRLGLEPRSADPDAVLAEFSSAREAMLGASRDTPFEELTEISSRQAATRDAAVAALSDAPTVRLFDRNDRAVVVGPGMGPGEDGRFRVTYFDADREPTNHTVFETREEALNAALREGFVSRSAAPAAPVPEDFGFYQDNPALTRSSGVEWLEHKQRVAEDTYGERRGITGSTTATLGSGDKDMFLPTDFMRRIPGLLDERRVPGEVQYERLMQDVRERGFLPDQDGNRIVLGINHRGEPFIIEGNTRTAVASDLGIPNVRVEVRYKNGGEMVEGPFAPENIARIAARGPSGSRPENFAQGGAVMMRSGIPQQINQGIGSLNEVARGMFRGGPVQYMQAGGPAVSYAPQRGGDFDTFASGSDLAIQMMREARDPMFYDGEMADRFLQAVPFGDAYYGEYTLEGAREDVGAPRRTEPGSDFFGMRSEPAVERQFEAANIRDMVELLRYLESVPEDRLSARDRALRDEIPQYLASRTGM